MLNDQELIHELALRVNSDEAIWAEVFGKAISLDDNHNTVTANHSKADGLKPD